MQTGSKVDQEAHVLFKANFLAEDRSKASDAVAMLASRIVVQFCCHRLLLQQQDPVAHQFALAELDPQFSAVVGHGDVNGARGVGRLLDLLHILRVVHQDLSGLCFSVHRKQLMQVHESYVRLSGRLVAGNACREGVADF